MADVCQNENDSLIESVKSESEDCGDDDLQDKDGNENKHNTYENKMEGIDNENDVENDDEEKNDHYDNGEIEEDDDNDEENHDNEEENHDNEEENHDKEEENHHEHPDEEADNYNDSKDIDNESDSGHEATKPTPIEDKKEASDNSYNESENSQSEDSGSGSGGSSDSSVQRERPRKRTVRDVKKMAEEDPHLYGVRRSSRARKEPERLVFNPDEAKNKSGRPGRQRRDSQKRSESGSGSRSRDGSSSGSGSDSSFADGYRPAKRTLRVRNSNKNSKPQKKGRRRIRSESTDESDSSDNEPNRASSRSLNTKKVSYQESSADQETDEDDVLEWNNEKEDEIVEDVETIERILHGRKGRKGAIGGKTTKYNVEDNGDPNEGFNIEVDESETHYLVKWKYWAHIHNTWETEQSLRDQKVNGLKKLEIFQKNMDTQEHWRKYATPEDVEYYECQQEMSTMLNDTYCLVERIISEKASRQIPPSSLYPDYLIKKKKVPTATLR